MTPEITSADGGASVCLTVDNLGLGVDRPDRKVRLYRAMVWKGDRPGLRVSVLAENLEEAEKKLEAEHGEGNVFYLHNEEDAARPR